MSFSEAFNPDDPSLLDHHPEYDTDTHLGDKTTDTYTTTG